jgi:TolB protein
MQVVFMRTKPGIQPSGAGALFVVGADGGRAERITPWGSAFLDQAWSPDGRWITFERPYGELYLVRPDASDLHAVPVQLPTGAGAETPSWSAVGRWIVFSLHAQGRSNIFAVRPDGTGLRRITSATEGDLASPDWPP